MNVDARKLAAGLAELDELSRAEYGAAVADLLTGNRADDTTRLARVGRLIGVSMKEPFATPVALPAPSPYTGARRAWELRGKDEFERVAAAGAWQSGFLEQLHKDPALLAELGWTPETTYEFLDNAQTERGFFGYLALSCRKYLCRDGAVRDAVNENVESAKREGLDVRNVTPEVIVSAAGTALGTLLVQSIPVLAVAGAPVIAGLVVIIYSIGVDAFCQWSADRGASNAAAERT